MIIALTRCQVKGEGAIEGSETNNIFKNLRNENAYSSKEESINYMQYQLEAKYNEDFVINESSISYDNQHILQQ